VYACSWNDAALPPRNDLWRIHTTDGGSPINVDYIGEIGLPAGPSIRGCEEVGFSPAPEPAAVGIWRPNFGLFLLDLNANGRWDGVAGGDCTSRFGAAGDRPVAGDWNRDGRSEVGAWRPATGRFLLDLNGNGRWDGTAGGEILTGWFGLPGDRPAIGDWTGDGPAEVGFWGPDYRRFRLDANANDRWDGPSGGDRVTASFGEATDIPVTGRW
jgi:hypothetical protein